MNPFNSQSYMSLKYYLSRFWLALSISFLLLIPYLTRYAHEFNRWTFHWNRWDLISLLFTTVLLGALFFLGFVILYIHGKKFTRKAFDLLFIATFAIALVANVLRILKSQLQISPSSPQIHLNIFLLSGYILWGLLGILVILTGFKFRKKIKTLCITVCFIVSPIIPIFTLTALRCPSISSSMSSLFVDAECENLETDSKRNVYIFIFDEWSYYRSFNKQELLADFVNLKHFKDSAFVFHEAFSPSPNTFSSMPLFLFQTKLKFIAHAGKMEFRDRNFHPLNRAGNIFRHPRELGFYTCIIGSYVPYGELLGESVNFSKSIPCAKCFGDSFLGVSKYHLITALLKLPDPFFVHEREKITKYFENRFQVYQNNALHEMYKTIVQNQPLPTFAVFHYMIPHFPLIYNRDGPKKLFNIYQYTPSNYYGNLAYLDTKIGEIISVLKKANKFETSLIIMTSDHSWRHDPDYGEKWVIRQKCHIPLFIKFPNQDRSIKINSKFSLLKLGAIINKYLDGDFDIKKAKTLLDNEDFFVYPKLIKIKKKPLTLSFDQ